MTEVTSAKFDSINVGDLGLRISNTSNELPGTLRYNYDTELFEGYTGSNDSLGNTWHTLSREMASATTLGSVKIGTNLNIQSDGVLSSIAEGISRFNQNVITIATTAGKGDYQTVAAAITYLNDLISQDSSNKPSYTNQYIILLSPGIYYESVTLPDYVSLQGDANKASILSGSVGDTELSSSAVIQLGDYSTVTNMTVKHTGESGLNAVGIYGSTTQNNYIFNVDVELTGTSTNNYGVLLESATAFRTNFLNITISGGTGSNYGFYNNGSYTELNYLKVVMTPAATANYGIYNYVTDNVYIFDTDVKVSGGDLNVGIKNIESSPQYKNSHIAGNFGTSGSAGCGIDNDADTESYTVTGTDIAFVSSATDRDRITVSSGVSDFKVNQLIKVTGSSQAQNNQTFTINEIDTTNSQLILGSNQLLTTVAAGDSVTIKQYYTQILDNCVITGYTHSINHVNTIDYFATKLGNTRLDGGLVNLNSNLVYFRDLETIVVAPEEGDFSSISAALDSINDNTSVKRYLIDVRPGSYTESSRIVMKQYVSIMGSGLENTVLNFDISGTDLSSSSACIELASDVSIDHIQFKNTVTSSSDTNAQIMYGDGLSNVSLNHVKIVISGNMTLSAVTISDSTLDFDNMNLTVTGGSSSTNLYGFKLATSTFDIHETSITITGASTNSYGSHITNSNGSIRSDDIVISGSSNNTGILCTNNVSADNLILLDACYVDSDDNSGTSISLNGNILCVAVGCRLSGSRTYNEGTGARLKALGCYEISGSSSLTYTPINVLGSSESSSNQNSIIGNNNVGNQSMTGVQNTVAGYGAGNSLTTGSYNVLLGRNSGNSVTTGNNLTYVGTNSGENTTTGNNNTFLGKEAGYNNVSGSDLTIIGYQSGYTQTAVDDVVFIGSSSGYSNSSGTDLVAIGKGAGYSNTTGSNSVFIGNGASSTASGYNNTTGSRHVYIGAESGTTGTTNTDNVIIGYAAGKVNTASLNTFVGSYAGTANTSGTYNLFAGYKSGTANTTADYNTFLGYQAGIGNTTGNRNLMVGSTVGTGNTTGSYNVFLGSPYEASSPDDAPGYNNTTGASGVFIGSGAGAANTTGSNNVNIGRQAGYSATTASRNLFVGTGAGYTFTTASDNVMMGYNAGYYTTTAGQVYIGSYAGENNSGDKSVLIGYQAGQNTDGDDCVYIGYQAGKNTSGSTTGDFNVGVGAYAARNIQTGTKNTFMGGGNSTGELGAGSRTTSGYNNTAIGYLSGAAMNALNNTFVGCEAGRNVIGNTDTGNPQGQSNVFVGTTAGYSCTYANYSVGIGHDAAYSLTSGSHNANIGFEAGYSFTTGAKNVGFGNYSLRSNVTGDQNTSVGYKAGYSSTGDSNTFFGYQAGYANTTGTNNIIGGFQAGVGGDDPDSESPSITSMTGSYNIFMGNRSGYQNTTGLRNTFLGYQTGYSNTTGTRNIFLGDNSGYSNTTGARNIFMGASDGDTNSGAGYSNTTGNRNSFIGFEAGNSNTTGSDNVCFGPRAGKANTTGDRNLYAGNLAGTSGTTGSDNISFGTTAGFTNTTGSSNINIGNRAGFTSQTGASNIMIGNRAGFYNTQGFNIMIGTTAGFSNSSGQDNICIGTTAGYSNETSSSNICIGTTAGYSNTAGSNVICIGKGSGETNTQSNNIFFGIEAGTDNSTGQNVLCMGYRAGYQNTSGGNQVFIGSQSGYSNTSGSNQVFIGSDAGYSNTTGAQNIAIGYQAAYDCTSGDNNISVGYRASYNITTGANNVIIGTESGLTATTAANNVMIGHNAGYSQTTVNNNIHIGYQSGYSNTTGANNLNIGTTAGYNATTGGCNLNIGYEAGFGLTTGINNITLGYQTGKALTTAQNCVFMGYQAGQNGTVTGDKGHISVGYQTSNNIGPYADKSTVIGQSCCFYNYQNRFSAVLGNEANNAGVGGLYNVVVGYRAGYNLGFVRLTVNGSHSSGASSLILSINDSGIQSGDTPFTSLGTNYFYVIRSDGTHDEYETASTTYDYNSGSPQITLSSITVAANYSGGEYGYVGSVYDQNAGVFGNDDSIAAANILFGSQAGYNLLSGSKNIALGNDALYTNKYGNYNVCIGPQAGYTATSTSLICIGTQAGYSITTGNENLCIGFQAGYSTTTGYQNISIGHQSGFTLSTGFQNVFIGYQAGYNATTCDQNIAIGYRAGLGLTSGNNNLIMGYEAGYNLTTGQNNTCIGANAGGQMVSGYDNAFIGPNAGLNSGQAIYNVGIGPNACRGDPATAATNSFGYNVCLGINTGISLTTGYDNDLFGDSAGTSITTGLQNYCAGWQSGTSITTGNSNFCLGRGAGSGITTGGNNICVGTDNMNSTVTGNYNLVLGSQSGTSVTSGDYNVIVGAEAGISLSTGARNAIIGYRSGRALTTQSNNTYIGYQCARNHTGSGCLIFGVEEDSPSSTSGDDIFAVYKGASNAGLVDANTTLSGDLVNRRVGVGLLSPSVSFHVQSTSEPQFRLGYDGSNYVDFGVASDGTMDIDLKDNVSAALSIDTSGKAGILTIDTTNSAEKVNITSDLTLGDNNNLQFGAGTDLTIVHNTTNSVITSATGNMIIDNTNTTGATVVQLGTDTSATSFQVQNDSGTAFLTVYAAAPSVGSGFDGAEYEHWITFGKLNTAYVNQFNTDITDLVSSATTAYIIGESSAANCHFGQVTAGLFGTLFMVKVECLEAPAGGNADIDFYSSEVGTGTQGNDAALLSGATKLLDNGGNWAVGDVKIFADNPSDAHYMYMTSGSASGGTYTAGKFLITFYGA